MFRRLTSYDDRRSRTTPNHFSIVLYDELTSVCVFDAAAGRLYKGLAYPMLETTAANEYNSLPYLSRTRARTHDLCGTSSILAFMLVSCSVFLMSSGLKIFLCRAYFSAFWCNRTLDCKSHLANLAILLVMYFYHMNYKMCIVKCLLDPMQSRYMNAHSL